MRIFGFNIERIKAGPPVPVVESRGGWFPIIREPFAGAWQRNISIDRNTVLSNPVVYSVITRIAGDMAKMPAAVERFSEQAIWTPDASRPDITRLLLKPNHYQTAAQFRENWILSKASRGNTYVLKQRGRDRTVTALYILDPSRVKPMVTDDSQVYYQLSSDNMSGLPADVMVPASEIIHDRFNCLFHPLVGTSPIFAAAVAAAQGLAIQNNSAAFFGNQSRPSGILVAPGAISDENAKTLKEAWDTNFSGENAGKIAVLGDGLKYEKMTMSAEESQLVEQLKWTAEMICSVFHVPPYMIGLGQFPGHDNVDAVLSMYWSLCLQDYADGWERCLTDGLGLDDTQRIQMDEDALLRMNKTALYKSIAEGIRGGFLTPNEGRRKINRPPLDGGDTVYLQEQDHSLAALAKRDALPDPFAKSPASTSPATRSAERIVNERLDEFATELQEVIDVFDDKLVEVKANVMEMKARGILQDRGLHERGKTYEPGDGVTYKGSYWVCRKTTADLPDMGDAWHLAVKRGRDGRDARSARRPDQLSGEVT